VHDQFSWTACYNNMCWTHQSLKNRAEWYLQKLHEKHEDYNTTEWSELRFEVKELAILKKEEIKEINTHKIQIEDYSNSIWIILNLNADQKDINNWEVNMKLKNQYEHSENQHRVLHKCLLEEQQMKLKRKFETFQKEQWEVKEKMMYKEFNRLMKKIKIIIHETSVLDSLVKHKIIIYLLEKFITKSEE